MPSPPSPRLVEAITRAATQAEDRRAAMQRLPTGVVRRRLRLEALDCALSPLAQDQLLALALEDLADAGGPGQRLAALGQPLADIDRLRIRHALAQGPLLEDAFDLRAVVSMELERGGQSVGRQPISLADWLRGVAALQAELWDHPALPVDPALRIAMRDLGPRLVAHGRWLRATAITLECSPRPTGLMELVGLKSR